MVDDEITIANAHDIGFDDFAGLHQLLVKAFAFMDERIDPPSSMHKLTPEGLHDKAGNEWLILALQGTALVGCLFARPEYGAVYIGKIAVRSEARGNGTGAKLLGRAQEIAVEKGYSALELEVRVELTENQCFFEKHGFIKSGENAHEGYTRPTSFLYSKQIS